MMTLDLFQGRWMLSNLNIMSIKDINNKDKLVKCQIYSLSINNEQLKKLKAFCEYLRFS